MKKLLLSFALLLGGSFCTVSAWTGNDPSSSTTTAGDTSDDKTFVLYNVGTGKFMVNGGIWGTQAVLDEKLVTTFNVVSSTTNSGTYKLYTNIETATGHYMNYSNGSNMKNAGYLFLDQGKDDQYSDFVFTAVTGKDNVYTIKTQSYTYYLTAEETTDYGTVIGKTSSASDENAQWQLVSVKDLKANFSAITGSETEPATASFMVQDPGFGRGDQGISNWYRGHSTSNSALLNNVLLASDTDQKGTSISHYVLPSSAEAQTISHTVRTYTVTCYYYYYYWGRREDTHSFKVTTTDEELTTGTRTGNFITDGDNSHSSETVYQQTVTLTKTETTETTTDGYTYYVGNGYNDPGQDKKCVDETNGSTTLCSTTHDYLQQEYGGYWTANIHGESGTIFQQMKITRAGIYAVSCKGFTTDGTGYIFANVGDAQGSVEDETYVTSNLSQITSVPGTYVAASKVLSGLGYSTVIIKVKDASEDSPVTLTFGAFTTGGSSSSWTCVDDFTLDFYGEIVNDLLLDEDQTSIDYINAQVIENEGQTLYLHRTFTVGKWNSLVLPVDMTASQVTTAFGEGTMLSTLNRTANDGKQIIFEPATEIKAGQLYIIKPSKTITSNSKTVTIDGTDYKVDSYYQCARIQLNNKLTSAQVEGSVKESTEDNGIKHVGTYVKNVTTDATAIPAYSYILSGGKWYYSTSGVNTVKGFRGWIETKQSKSDAESTKFVINGVSDDVTAIEGITAEPVVMNRTIDGVYTLGGQKVRDGQDLTGLAKGIYIVGGKKQVVK